MNKQNEELFRANDLEFQNNALKKLNQFALELSYLTAEENIEAFIAHQIKEFTGAKAAIFSEYNPSSRTMSVTNIEIESGLLDKVIDLLGTQIHKIKSFVSDERYKEMTTKRIAVIKTLHEASFGALSLNIGAAIQNFLNIDRIIGVAYNIEGKLFGTSLLGMEKGKPDPPLEILETFVHFAAASLRRNKAETSLKESEKKYSQLIEYAQEGVWIIDINSLTTYVNQKMVEILGYSKEEMQGKCLFDFMNDQGKEKAIYYIERRKQGIIETHYFEFMTKTGKMIYTNISTNPIFDKNGNYSGAMALVTDISLQKQKEQQLLENEKKLLQLNADKDKFFSIIAHDLRSPFNILLGYTQKMADELDSMAIKDVQKISVQMNKSAADLYNLLENLLNWTSMKQGLIQFRPQRIVLEEIFNSAVEILRPNAEAKNILIRYSVTGRLTVFADVEMLKMVIRNLVSNAIKFTNTGGEIIISAEQTTSTVTISVSDNGVGMKKEDLSRLFDISRLQSTPGTANEKGTGLGLMLCKEFVEKHGGKICAKSEAGCGSIFKITLPL